MSSTLIVQVCEVSEVKQHPNADRLDIAVIKGWDTVVKKGEYKAGDTVVYIPPDAILPLELVEKLGVGNYLAGKEHNRVKCTRLRGEMSFGLVIPNEGGWTIGTDLSEYYGITKYVPPVRFMAGDAAPDDPLFDKYTDIENMRNFPDIIQKGEMVVITEKIDGSNFRLGFEKLEDGNLEWKAGSHKIKRKMPNVEEIEDNTYWFPYLQPNVRTLMDYIANSDNKFKGSKTATLFGEVYGKIGGGHKSLNYGRPDSLNFVVFDIQVDGKYLDYEEFEELTNMFCIPTVPLLDKIPFSIGDVKKYSSGHSVLAERNDCEHMREGCVVRPITERNDPILGRVILKFLNDDYLILKNKKEEKGEVVDFTDE
jgi:RNA ligase (TIGR02306 family)